MGGNNLKNAAFLDGTTNWAALGGATLAVDEATYGAPGRVVLKATHTATGSGETSGAATASADRISVAAGQAIRAHGMVAGFNCAIGLSVAIYDGGGSEVGRVALPAVRLARGAPKRGLRSRFTAFYGEFNAPASGHASLEAQGVSTAAGAVTVILLKPRLGDLDGETYAMFDPGPSDNVDLNLPVWPSSLPPVMEDNFTPTQTPTRKAFDADAGIKVTRKIAGSSLTQIKARFQLTDVQEDDLRAFAEDPNNATFWFVRPDTDEVCLAEWLDGGDPTMVQSSGPTRIWEVGLQLAVV